LIKQAQSLKTKSYEYHSIHCFEGSLADDDNKKNNKYDRQTRKAFNSRDLNQLNQNFMKQFSILVLTMLLFVTTINLNAQVGIGTTNPSPNSVLDLTSPDKGLMLPRVNDTTSVSNPSAGLMIYDLNAQSPAFHNGASWNPLAGTSPSIQMLLKAT
jgi:hypothetical protein